MLAVEVRAVVGEGLAAAHGKIERPGDQADGVADLFGVEALPVLTPEIAVLRVGGGVGGNVRAGQLISLGEQDQLVQLLNGPAVFDEAGGQVVEQFRMGRGGAANAEIRGGRDDAFPEMVMPDPVDHDPGGQRVSGIGQPFGEFLAATARFRFRHFHTAQNQREAAADLSAGVFRLAVDLNLDVVWFAFRHGPGGFERRVGFRDGLQVFTNFREFFPDHFAGAAGREDLFVLKFLILVELLPFQLLPGREGFVERFQNLGGLIFADAIDEIAAIGIVLFAGEGVGGAVEDAVERVIVGGRDGIELVIVAAGAADAQAEHGLSEVPDGVFESDVAIPFGADADAARDGNVAGGYDLLPALVVVFVRQKVAGDLLAKELVVGFVVAEGVDDVVPVFVHLRNREVGGVARGIGIADHVEPVPAPAFAVLLGGEHLVDPVFEGFGRIVGDEGRDFLAGSGKAGEVEGGAAEESGFVGLLAGLEAFFLQLRVDELIDRITVPLGAVGRGRDGLVQGLEGPEGFLVGTEHVRGGRRGAGFRPDRAVFDPFSQACDGVVWNSSGGGHL